ncbi:hypothetical protein CBLAS_0021 [Campylobacter blaseri]|uniref:hypothetical protein n=1 Tax=Campylobacter blaseri TaxID=2042961 RepID=UPI0012FFF1E8|nr:hypothetical protein [Campylobacter blaseri]QKF85239.1 hypothetical protein CBLAS_0021 [Campylobacter blaseri]
MEDYLEENPDSETIKKLSEDLQKELDELKKKQEEEQSNQLATKKIYNFSSYKFVA